MHKLLFLSTALILTINARAQNVGIGTTTPQAKLEVNGSLNTPSVPGPGTSSGVFRLAGSSNGGLDFGIHTVPWMQAGFGGVPADISLQALGGKVGIGTASPQYLLHIKSLDDAVHAIDAGTTGAAWNYYLQNGTLRSAIGWSNINSALSFYVNGADRMAINNSGNVGLGITSPDALLHLHKATNPMLLFTNSNSGSTANDGAAIWLEGNNMKIDNVENGDIIFNTNLTERMRITNSGNLKITDGTQGSGKVLTSDANGNASWQPAPGGQVAFKAAFRNNFNTLTITNNSDVVFDTVYFNLGNGYNNTTGVFTAPLNGLYYFYTQLTWYTIDKPHTVGLQMRYGAGWQWIYSGAEISSTIQDYFTTSCSGFFYMAAGETVSIRAFEESTGTADLMPYMNETNFFGYKVY